MIWRGRHTPDPRLRDDRACSRPLLESLLRAHGPTGHEHLAYTSVREASATSRRSRGCDRQPRRSARRSRRRPLLALFAHLDVIGLAAAHVDDDGLIAVAHARRLAGRRSRTGSGSRSARRTGRCTASSRASEKRRREGRVDAALRRRRRARRRRRRGLSSAPAIRWSSPLRPSSSPPVALRRATSTTAPACTSRSRRCGGWQLRTSRPTWRGRGCAGGARRRRCSRRGASAAARCGDRDRRDLRDRRPGGRPPQAPATTVLGGGAAIFRGPGLKPPSSTRSSEPPRGGNRLHGRDGNEGRTRTPTDLRLARGNPDGLVSIPLRYMHSPIEVAELADLEACIEAGRRVRPAAAAADASYSTLGSACPVPSSSSAVRTPFGRLGGGLAGLQATELGSLVIRAALDRAGMEDGEVEYVIMGQVLQAAPARRPHARPRSEPASRRRLPLTRSTRSAPRRSGRSRSPTR